MFRLGQVAQQPPTFAPPAQGPPAELNQFAQPYLAGQPQPDDPYGGGPMDAGQPIDPQALMQASQQTPGPYDTQPTSPYPFQGKVPMGFDDVGLSNGIGMGDGPDYEDVPAIDYDNLQGINRKNIKELADTVWDLAMDGILERNGGGRDGMIEVWRNMYELAPPSGNGPFPGSCNIVTPDLPDVTDTVSARRVEAIVKSSTFIDIDIQHEEELDAATWCKKFAVTELYKGLGLARKLNVCDKTASVDGQQIIHTMWRREKRKVKKRVRIDNNLLIKMGIPPVANPNIEPYVKIGSKKYLFNSRQLLEFDEIYNNHFDFEFWNVKDCFMWPATSRTIENATLFGMFFLETDNELKQKAADGYYDEDAVDEAIKIPGNISPLDSEILSTEAERELSEDGIGKLFEHGNKFGRRQLAHIYARVQDVDDDGVFEDLCIVIDWVSRVILRCQTNPYNNCKRPFYPYCPDPRIGHGFYGYSMPQRLEGITKELNTITRQGIDRGSLAATVFMGVDRAAKDPKATEINVGGINIWDSAQEGIIRGVYPLPDMPNGNLANRNDARKMLEKAAAADESTQGVADNTQSTLGQTNIAVNAGNIRLNRSLYEVMDSLTWLYNQFFDYCNQFLEEEYEYTLVRDGKRPYNPVELLNNISITQECVVTATCDQLRSDNGMKEMIAEKGFTAITNSPAVNGKIVPVMRAVRQFLDSIEYQGDIDSMIGTEEQWQQQQTEQDMMQQMTPPGMEPNGGGGTNQQPNQQSKTASTPPQG